MEALWTDREMCRYR